MGKSKAAAGDFKGDALSRRSFLSLAGFGTAAVASSALLGGCTTQYAEQTKASAASDGSPDSSLGAHVETFETDLIIVGAGNAASSAAWSALREGVTRIIMIEKGPRQQSGHTNTSWAGFSVYTDIEPETPLSQWQAPFLGKPWSSYLVNTHLTRNAFDLYKEGARDFDKRNRGVTMLNYGQYIPARDDKGEIIPLAGTMCLWQWYRKDLDGVVSKDSIDVLDKTMATELIVQDGTCCGVVALHIPTGTVRVIRSKAVIVATSGVGINYGRLPVHSVSAGSPDNTFDLEYSAYRHGVGIAECEYGQYDVYNGEPKAIAVTAGCNVTCDAQGASSLVTEEGDLVFAPDDERVNDRNYFSQQVGKAIKEHGAVYMDLREDTSKAWTSAHAVATMKEFGFDLSKDVIPAVVELYEHGGAPVVDENIMTELKGLFWTRGAGTIGELGGTCVFTNHIFGNYAGHKAGRYALSQENSPEFDWQVVVDEQNRLERILSATPENGIRPCEIRHRIQEAFYQAFTPYRTKQDIDSALAELERIAAEDMPSQYVADDSRIWNKDWKEAIENEGLLVNALMSVRATAFREESRGGYIREDFPAQDDENWSCLVVCKKDGEQMVLEKQYLPDVVD